MSTTGGVSVIVLENRLPRIAAALPAAVDLYCEGIAADVVKLFAVLAARRTGYMAESGYVVTRKRSTYGQIPGGPASGAPLPEVDKPTGAVRAIAAIAAAYTVFVEFGTRNQAAQPAFYPAIDVEKSVLPAKLADFQRTLNLMSGGI